MYSSSNAPFERDEAVTKPVETNATAKLKKPKLRSPNYPVVGLGRAVELAAAFHKQYGTHPVPLMMIHKLWGFEEGSNTGNQCVAALKSYGLMDVTGEGETRKAAMSKTGIRVVANAPDRAELLKTAALLPAIHREIVDHYDAAGLPANELLERYLVWDRPDGKRFNASTVKAFIARFRATLAFAGGVPGDKMAAEEGDDDDPPIEEENGSNGTPPPPVRKEKRRMITEGSQEFAFELEEGPAVLTLPQGLGDGSTEDLEDWLKLVIRKIKRTAMSSTNDAAGSKNAAVEDQEDE